MTTKFYRDDEFQEIDLIRDFQELTIHFGYLVIDGMEKGEYYRLTFDSGCEKPEYFPTLDEAVKAAINELLDETI